MQNNGVDNIFIQNQENDEILLIILTNTLQHFIQRPSHHLQHQESDTIYVKINPQSLFFFLFFLLFLKSVRLKNLNYLWTTQSVSILS